jgi:hypothetical protein
MPFDFSKPSGHARVTGVGCWAKRPFLADYGPTLYTTKCSSRCPIQSTKASEDFHKKKGLQRYKPVRDNNSGPHPQLLDFLAKKS